MMRVGFSQVIARREVSPRMTSPPSPPNRRRRRIVVAVAVLVLVSAVAWWNLPRGDARFVGKWHGHDSRLVNPMILKSNGQGVILVGGVRSVFPWHVDGEWLVLGWSPPKPLANVADQASALSQRHLGVKLPTREFRYRVVELTEGKLRLNLNGVSGNDTEYARVP
jgi:hypothetical protein